MDEVAKLIKQRNRLLMFAALSFVLWQGAWLGQDVMADYGLGGEPLNTVVGSILILGSIGWVVSTLLYLSYASKVTQTGTQSVIEDELFHHNSRLATRAGFMAMLGALALLLAADTFIDFSATIAIRATMILGVFVPLVTFVRCDSSGVEETH